MYKMCLMVSCFNVFDRIFILFLQVHGSLESKSKERVHECKAKDRGHGCKAKDRGLWSLVTCHWSLVTCLWSLVITLSLESSRVFGVLSLYSVRAKDRGHGALEFSVVIV